MKKSTLFVSVLAGLGSLVALFTVLSKNPNAQYISRDQAENINGSEFNNDFFTAMRKNVGTGKVESTDYLKAVEEAKSFKNSRATTLNWEFSGPDNIGGRARVLVIDKDDENLLYSGGAGGGLYISKDAAGTWEYKSTNWENIHISTIAQDGNGRVYAGTGMYADAGSAVGGAFPGGGIWASADRGETWARLASTIPSPYSPGDPWAYVNRIAVGKNKNSQGNYSIYAGTRSGLYVSLDNGVTWTEPFTLPNCNNVLHGNIQDVVTTTTGRVLVSYSGSLYYSDAGETKCSYTPVGVSDGIGGSSRMSLTVCSSDENIVYAFQGYGGNPGTFLILKSTDGGATWADLQPAPPTAIIDSTFDLMGTNPVNYNQAIAVDPNDCDRIYVGAVELYRVAGAWSSVAINFGSSRVSVHSDKHWFQFSQHTANTMYVATDGGIGKTTNAAASNVNWTENNRHLGTTQYYGVAMSKEGQIIGGTQDNGTHLIDPTLGGPAAKDGLEIFGGDGFDCEISNIANIGFVTSQYGAVGRGSYKAGGSGGTGIHPSGRAGSGNPPSPFHTIIRNWETVTDLTSLDSITFKNDTARFSVGSGDGLKKVYSGKLRRVQSAAKIVPGQVKLEDIAGGQVATDGSANGVLKSFGDSVGFINYNTGEYSVRWSFAPPVGSAVNSVFNLKFNAGDTLELKSQNMSIPFNFILTQGMVVNDSIVAQDPVQSLLVVSMQDGFDITREAMYFPLSTPNWIRVKTIRPTCFEFSNDGDHLYVGGYSGSIIRISGLNNFYSGSDPDVVLTKTRIYSGSGSVSGINIHPTDPEKLLVTVGGYGSPNHIYELTQAQSATSNSSKRLLQGDLPDFPVYDPEYNVNNTDQVLIGTELGLWACDDISGSSPSWTQQSGVMGNVPVLDVRQQRLPYTEAANFGRFYIGTFGRGIWTSGDLVGVDDDDSWANFGNDFEINSLKMYPNPVSSVSQLTFEMPTSGTAEVSIYDISGKMVRSQSKNYTAGTAVYDIDSSSMPGGTYFVTVKLGKVQGSKKFVVVK